MTETSETAEEEPKKKKGFLIPAALTAILGGAGFATTYLGLWSPSQALSFSAEEAADHAVPAVEFVTVPTIDLPLPGSGHHGVILGVMIETDHEHSKAVRHLTPRLSDAFNAFLSEIDPAAFDKRGVLEIVRAELLTRSRYVLGDAAISDLLITEFRLK